MTKLSIGQIHRMLNIPNIILNNLRTNIKCVNDVTNIESYVTQTQSKPPNFMHYLK
jgi:hypothetical protein